MAKLLSEQQTQKVERLIKRAAFIALVERSKSEQYSSTGIGG